MISTETEKHREPRKKMINMTVFYTDFRTYREWVLLKIKNHGSRTIISQFNLLLITQLKIHYQYNILN